MRVKIERIKDGKILTLKEFALEVNKDGGHLIYCDMDSVFQDVEDKSTYIVGDECGNFVYLDRRKYKVKLREVSKED